jgi:hexosaminidase
MRIKTFVLALVALLICGAELSAQNITPAPVRFQGGTCSDSGCLPAMPFDYSQLAKLYVEGAQVSDVERIAAAIKAAGLDLKRVKQPSVKSCINIYINPDSMPYDEGYAVVTSERCVDITARSSAGAFYALQTVRQLVESGEWLTGAIVDYPRFEYRGVLIDISRHFRTMDFLKRQIDMMARLKMNRLHLHLTDAAGWRLQIDSYPRLTSFAAWRTPHDWKGWWNAHRKHVEEGSEGASGGYLTNAQARELVA